jgi:hypothetical protein
MPLIMGGKGMGGKGMGGKGMGGKGRPPRRSRAASRHDKRSVSIVSIFKQKQRGHTASIDTAPPGAPMETFDHGRQGHGRQGAAAAPIASRLTP